MNIPVVKPKVQIIAEFDAVKKSWIISRPHLMSEDLSLHEIDDIDLPVHGMAVYALHITGSLAMRELCFMLRPQTGAWAISNRTIDLLLSHMQISEEVPKTERLATGSRMREFLAEKAKGVSQDSCKDLLPYGFVTDFTFVVDKRTLANVVKNMKKGFPFLYEYYGKQLNELIPGLETLAGGGWILDNLNLQDSDRSQLETGPYKMGRMNLVGGKIQGVLLAQFIRKIYDNVYCDIITDIKDGSIYSKPQNQEYTAALYVTDASLAKMQSTRTCAFAMFDKEDNSSWSSVLGKNVKNLTTIEFRDQLPCGGCASKCSYRKEQLPRLIAGNNVDYGSQGEVNPPCAIQTGIKGTHFVRGLKFQSKSIVYDKWTEMLNEMKLEITEDGKEYLKNVETYGFAEALDNEPETKELYLSLLKADL